MPEETILVIGDIIVDAVQVVVPGSCIPEAPLLGFTPAGPPTYHPGGAANVAATLKALGQPVHLIGACDHPSLGAVLAGVSRRLVSARDRLVRTIKTRYVHDGKLVFRTDEDNQAHISPTDLLFAVDQAYRQFSIPLVVFSDYGKGVLSEQSTGELIAFCRKKGSLIIVDPKPRPNGPHYYGAHVLTPNLREAKQLAARRSLAGVPAEQFSINETLAALVTEDTTPIVTYGEEGVLTHLPPASFLQTPPPVRHYVYDVCGAGDAFVAGLTAALREGAPMSDAIEQGQLVAGIAVSRPLTYQVNTFDLFEVMSRRYFRKKLVSLEYATGLSRYWRASQNGTVVMTNGGFDMLHPGHLHSLDAARRFGTRLIVAVNTSESLEQLKGRKPLMDTDWRLQALCANQAVDAVVVFDAVDVGEVVRRLLPQVLVKGDDAQRPLPGEEYVQRVELLPRLPGFSSSALREQWQIGAAGG